MCYQKNDSTLSKQKNEPMSDAVDKLINSH